jgi:hypothetical protein
MSKITHIVGARPNFPKVAPIMNELAKQPERFKQLLVHTGQHYDYNMSQVFFAQQNPATRRSPWLPGLFCSGEFGVHRGHGFGRPAGEDDLPGCAVSDCLCEHGATDYAYRRTNRLAGSSYEALVEGMRDSLRR